MNIRCWSTTLNIKKLKESNKSKNVKDPIKVLESNFCIPKVKRHLPRVERYLCTILSLIHTAFDNNFALFQGHKLKRKKALTTWEHMPRRVAKEWFTRKSCFNEVGKYNSFAALYRSFCELQMWKRSIIMQNLKIKYFVSIYIVQRDYKKGVITKRVFCLSLRKLVLLDSFFRWEGWWQERIVF